MGHKNISTSGREEEQTEKHFECGGRGSSSSLDSEPGTCLTSVTVITDVKVQTGDEKVIGRLFHVMFLKILADCFWAAPK